ncbi:MAG TPA: hypothetical protein VIW45_05505, partial [Vicinamibacterales bacterium]
AVRNAASRRRVEHLGEFGDLRGCFPTGEQKSPSDLDLMQSEICRHQDGNRVDRHNLRAKCVGRGV